MSRESAEIGQVSATTRREIRMCNVPFLSIHALAAGRGDGLHPEFLALFERLALASEPRLEVVEVSRNRTPAMLHSGSNLAVTEAVALTEDVRPSNLKVSSGV